MKEKELRNHATCSICNNKIGHTGIPLFWKVKVERHAINMEAVKQQDGLASFLGNTQLAQVMGTDEEMTEKIIETDLVICETCICKEINLMEVVTDKINNEDGE